MDSGPHGLSHKLGEVNMMTVERHSAHPYTALKGDMLVDEFKAGMRRLAAGVSIVTTRSGDDWHGMTVTAVCSLSVSPPSVVVCVNRNAHAHQPICNSRTLAINVLANEHASLAQRFAGVGGIQGAERFMEGCWEEGIGGNPILTDALTVIECSVCAVTACQTHSVMTCVVDHVRYAGGMPLVYAFGEYHSLKRTAHP
jgi:flavin reductase (DIM6/NTAB) family NADH-FMN oxidoreductase RutF